MLLQIQEPDHKAKVCAVGIDLGTTHTVVSVPDCTSLPLIPSAVAYNAEGVVAVGAAALQHDPTHVVSSVKRLMGRSARDVVAFAHPLKEMPYGAGVQVAGHVLSPVEVSAEILKFAASKVKEALGYAVDQAVITVPAYFDEAARAATRDAARLAGLNVLRLLNEPTAAALAYGLDRGAEGLYGVYDWGGGTFDFSLLKMNQGVFQVLSTHGDLHLGGDDFDHALASFCFPDGLAHFPLGTQKQILKKMRHAKERLSSLDSVIVEGKSISRMQFEALVTPLIDRTLESVNCALQQADLKKEDLHGLIFMGGCTRVPIVRHRLEDFFQKPPLTHLDPDLGVALGAGLQAEALTHGAQHLLLDVTPLSLGIETLGGVVSCLIPRNTPIPTSVTQEFTTFEDGQTAMGFHVLQGESEQVEACRSLGRFELTGIPPLEAGAARVCVTFAVDADGLTTVTAMEKTTQTAQSIQVQPAYGLKEEVLQSLLQKSSSPESVWACKADEAKKCLEDIAHILAERGQALQQDEQQVLKDSCVQVEKVLETRDSQALDATLEELTRLCAPLVRKVFSDSPRSENQ